jgi:hypothetical protein
MRNPEAVRCSGFFYALFSIMVAALHDVHGAVIYAINQTVFVSYPS